MHISLSHKSNFNFDEFIAFETCARMIFVELSTYCEITEYIWTKKY